MTIPVGATQQYNASGAFSDEGRQDITTQTTWSSSNTSVATVNSGGLVTAVGAGIAVITATSSTNYVSSGNVSASVTVTVTPALSSIALTPGTPNIPAGATQQFTAIGTYSDGTSRDITTQVTWSSSNTSVAAVNSNGLATAIAAGTATITAVQGSVSGNTTLTVNSATLSSIAVTPADPSIPAGVTQQFTATGTYSDGTSRDITTQVTWSSSNTSVATLNSNGLAIAVAAGNATITAAQGSVSGNTTLTVNSATLSSIAVTPADPSIPAGVTQQFTATGAYSDGTSYDITTQVAWSSSNSSVATVTGTGIVTTIVAATATITAVQGSVSGSTTLTVNAAALSSIAVTPASLTIPVGAVQQFTATGTFSDGTSYVVTTQVTWTSSSPAIVTVDGNGLATAVAPGAVTITTTRGTTSGSTILTVTPG